MKAKELRIGNYVSLQGHEFKIDVVDILVFVQEKLIYEPIPLTKEWLLKFGFEIVDKKTYYKDNIPVIPSVYNTFLCKGIRMDNIHQLQNLYFALTNKELKIKQ